MPESKLFNEHNLDDKLASFADQVLAAGSGEAKMSEQDLELHSLEETILMLQKAALTTAIPPLEMQKRIHARLVNAWGEDQIPELTIFQKALVWFKTYQKQLIYAASALSILILTVLLLPVLSNSPLTGSAGPISADENNASLLQILILVLATVISGFFIWLILRSRK